MQKIKYDIVNLFQKDKIILLLLIMKTYIPQNQIMKKLLFFIKTKNGKLLILIQQE